MQGRSEAILQTIDSYLVVQASKLMNIHIRHGYSLADQLEVDDLVQRSRIKLWKVLEKKNIAAIYSYAQRVVYHEFIDMKRQQKQIWPLSEENDQLEGAVDPAQEFIQKVESALFLHSIARMVLALPPRQRQSILCVLHDYMDEMAQLRAVFSAYDVDLETARWPADKKEKRLLVASLSVARQKLAQKRGKTLQKP